MMNDISGILKKQVFFKDNYGDLSNNFDSRINQVQTREAFSEKWTNPKSDVLTNDKKFVKDQKRWFLELYGFSSEKELNSFCNGKIILDAGCGIGYKSAWIAEKCPNSLVIGMDMSESVLLASERYKNFKNLFFIKGDIADSPFKKESIDIVICDQVIMHTEDPNHTFEHLGGLVKESGSFFCYVYSKKALVRELIDDYFRDKVHDLSNEELWQLSNQLTELGKNLTELNVEVEVPNIPLLNIKKGKYDIQRFIYWNFIKCFYNKEWDINANNIVNYDWYSPSNAKRYSEKEFKSIINHNNFSIDFFHQEEACFSGRFAKNKLV